MYNFTGESKLDVCADIAEPLFSILTDPEIVELEKKKAPVSTYIKPAIKNHKDEVVQVLARLATEDGVTPEEYIEGTGTLAIGFEFMSLLTNKEMTGLFSSQGQSKDKTSSGSATENTEVNEK